MKRKILLLILLVIFSVTIFLIVIAKEDKQKDKSKMKPEKIKEQALKYEEEGKWEEALEVWKKDFKGNMKEKKLGIKICERQIQLKEIKNGLEKLYNRDEQSYYSDLYYLYERLSDEYGLRRDKKRQNAFKIKREKIADKYVQLKTNPPKKLYYKELKEKMINENLGKDEYDGKCIEQSFEIQTKWDKIIKRKEKSYNILMQLATVIKIPDEIRGKKLTLKKIWKKEYDGVLGNVLFDSNFSKPKALEINLYGKNKLMFYDKNGNVTKTLNGHIIKFRGDYSLLFWPSENEKENKFKNEFLLFDNNGNLINKIDIITNEYGDLENISYDYIEISPNGKYILTTFKILEVFPNLLYLYDSKKVHKIDFPEGYYLEFMKMGNNYGIVTIRNSQEPLKSRILKINTKGEIKWEKEITSRSIFNLQISNNENWFAIINQDKSGKCYVYLFDSEGNIKNELLLKNGASAIKFSYDSQSLYVMDTKLNFYVIRISDKPVLENSFDFNEIRGENYVDYLDVSQDNKKILCVLSNELENRLKFILFDTNGNIILSHKIEIPNYSNLLSYRIQPDIVLNNNSILIKLPKNISIFNIGEIK